MRGFSINPKQYAQHFPSNFYLSCCASQRHVLLTQGNIGHYCSCKVAFHPAMLNLTARVYDLRSPQ